MTRWFLRLGIVAVLVLGGWWWIATAGLERSIGAFWDKGRTDGLDVQVGETARAGFPLKIAVTQSDVVLQDFDVQTKLTLPAFTLSSPIYWPGDATLSVPEEPITFTTPQGIFILTSSGMVAAVKLHPGTALELEAMSATGGDVSLDMVEGRLLSIDAVHADIVQTSVPNTYDIDLNASGFALGSVIRQAMNMPVAWADAFEPIVADMTVSFDRPWDRNAVAANRPQPRRVQIDQITAVWADIGIAANGLLDVDARGVPNGELRLKVQNWQRIFDMAVASTDIPTGWQSTVEQVLGAMADADGTLDLPITMAGGQMRVGFFPLGPSPLLIIR